MRRHTVKVFAVIAALGVWLANSAPSQAHVVVTPDPGSLQSGITYEFQVGVEELGSTGSWQGGVGAKSWNEPGNPAGSKGWTHTSDWAALELAEGGNLTITVSRATVNGVAGTQLTPAFTLFQGWATGPTGSTGEWHTYNNVGNPYDTDPTNWGWASGQISYLDHEANPGSLESITRTIQLAAGQYSLAIGGNPADTTLTGQHGYLAQVSLSAVPVPAAVYLFGSGLIGLAGLARRRMTA
jgi:hypothetical protein